MSHDPNNRDCPYRYTLSGRCTCPPAADEVEQIRKRHDRVARLAQKAVVILDQMDLDRATLLRTIDTLTAELAETKHESSQHAGCAQALELQCMAKDAEIEMLRKQNADFYRWYQDSDSKLQRVRDALKEQSND